MGVPPGVRLRGRDARRRRPRQRVIEIAPVGCSAGRQPTWTQCWPAQAGLVAARPYGPNSFGGRQTPEQLQEKNRFVKTRVIRSQKLLVWSRAVAREGIGV